MLNLDLSPTEVPIGHQGEEQDVRGDPSTERVLLDSCDLAWKLTDVDVHAPQLTSL